MLPRILGRTIRTERAALEVDKLREEIAILRQPYRRNPDDPADDSVYHRGCARRRQPHALLGGGRGRSQPLLQRLQQRTENE